MSARGINRQSVIDDIKSGIFIFVGVDSASNRNEYQEPSWGGKARPARRADNLTAIYQPIG
jgi:hypothetical protein